MREGDYHFIKQKEKISFYQCDCCFGFLGLALVQGKLNKSHILHLERKRAKLQGHHCAEKLLRVNQKLSAI